MFFLSNFFRNNKKKTHFVVGAAAVATVTPPFPQIGGLNAIKDGVPPVAIGCLKTGEFIEDEDEEDDDDDDDEVDEEPSNPEEVEFDCSDVDKN